MDIAVEKVIPIRFGTKNIIICRRINAVSNLFDLSNQLDRDVKNVPNQTILEANQLYAFKTGKSRWSRGLLKFNRDNNIQVIQLVDANGTFDFNPNVCSARKIQGDELKNMPFAEIKLFIYGIGQYSMTSELKYVFEGLILNQETTAIFGLMERKANRIHECFVGDILYTFRSKEMSFREVLIREKLAVPARVQEELNQRIFSKRRMVMGLHNSVTTLPPSISPDLGIDVTQYSTVTQVQAS